MFFIDIIEQDIKKHKAAGLTDDEISLLPALDISVSDDDFLGLIVKTSRMNSTEKQKQKFTKQTQEMGLSGKAAESYINAQVSIWEKEQRKKIEEDAKLLGTAMQQLLPEIFEEKRAIPNCFLRGALFGMVRKGRRALVENQPIFTMSQYEVSFSGSEMDQNDLELWDTLMYLAKNRGVGSELRITLYDLCCQMRLSPTKSAYDALTKRVERLQLGQVKIKTGSKSFFGSLINNGYVDTDGDGKLVIEYNKKLAPLFAEDFTYISADIRHLLGDNQLARWLYNFYESHGQPIPFAIDFLQKLCRSENNLKDFKYKLKITLEQVKKAHLAVNAKSKWDYDVTLNNYVLIFPKGKTKRQLELFSRF